MKNEYLDYVESDRELCAIVGPVLADLHTLSPGQIQTFIFYLNSLHAYYPASENHIEHYAKFGDLLESLRVGGPQATLQRKAAGLLAKAMTMGIAAGIAAASGVVAWLGGFAGWGVGLFASALALFLVGEALFGRPALEKAKEQDRRYFLDSLRSARACNELDWAGLFSYNAVTKPGPQSDEDIEITKKRIAELSTHLRAALYNDEYMQYSGSRAPGK